MKIVLAGSGPRIPQIGEALAAPRNDLVVVSPDPSLRERLDRRIHLVAADPISFDPALLPSVLQPEDLIVICETREDRLRGVLDRLALLRLAGIKIAFTPGRDRKLIADHPDVLFRSDREIFRREVRALMRVHATIQRVNRLRAIAAARPKLLVLLWGNPDPDAMGSSFALRELLRESVPDIRIAHTGEFTRSENRAMARILKIPTQKFRPELLSPDTALATVDAQPSFFRLPERPAFDIVIDHHPLADGPEPPYADIRPGYGSTASILTEYFLHTNRRMPRRIATALYYGLKVDTGNLTRNVSDEDVESFGHLRTRADENAVRAIELSQMPIAILDHFAQAIARRRTSRDTIFCYLGELENPDTCVHVAEFFLKLSEIAWTVAACRHGERIVIVFRSDGYRKHAGQLAETLFRPYGTAGGHRTMARAELEAGKVEAEAGSLTDAAIEGWLLQKLGEKIRSLAPHPERNRTPGAL